MGETPFGKESSRNKEQRKSSNWEAATAFDLIRNPNTNEVEIQFTTEILDPEKIIEILKNGEVTYIASIDSVLPNIEKHQNLVAFYLVSVKYNNIQLYGVFKPYLGEGWGEIYTLLISPGSGLHQKITKEIKPGKIGLFENIAYYPREVFAYILSEKLGWGLVPPTVTRIIKGSYPIRHPKLTNLKSITYEERDSIGALQLFLPYPTGRQYFQKYNEEPVIKLIFENPELLFRCAIFDLLVGIQSRHSDDYLVNPKNLDIKLIDHGNSMLHTSPDSPKLVRSIFLILFARLNLIERLLEKYHSYEDFIRYNPQYQGIIREEAFKNIKALYEIVKSIIQGNCIWINKIIQELEKLKDNWTEFLDKIQELGLQGTIYDEITSQEIKLITEEDLEELWGRLNLLLKYLPRGIIPVQLKTEGLEIFNE